MKKILMTMVAAFAAVSMNAQVYVGGSLGFASYDDGNTSKTSFKLLPEVGYVLDEDMAVGITFGYEQGNVSNGVDSKIGSTDYPQTFSIAPYFRYNFTKMGPVTVFADGELMYASTKAADGAKKDNTFGVGIKPGIAVALGDKLSFVSHLGYLGYNQTKHDVDGAKARSSFGLDLANGLTFGLYYNF